MRGGTFSNDMSGAHRIAFPRASRTNSVHKLAKNVCLCGHHNANLNPNSKCVLNLNTDLSVVKRISKVQKKV
jgi:hypothetical protein